MALVGIRSTMAAPNTPPPKILELAERTLGSATAMHNHQRVFHSNMHGQKNITLFATRNDRSSNARQGI